MIQYPGWETRGPELEGLVEGGVCPHGEELLEPAEGDPLPSTPRLEDPTRAEGVLRSWSRYVFDHGYCYCLDAQQVEMKIYSLET